MSSVIESSVESLDRRLAYGILRFTVGIDMLLHGVTRIFLNNGVNGFAEGLARDFSKSPLPEPLVRGFGLALPFAEAALGVLLVLGWRTRWAAATGGLLMAVLIFGTALRSEWNTIGLQLTYSLLYAILLFLREKYDFYALDTWLARRSRSGNP
jgi:thiosulfate dehydrogenase [quinone] large subunit